MTLLRSLYCHILILVSALKVQVLDTIDIILDSGCNKLNILIQLMLIFDQGS